MNIKKVFVAFVSLFVFLSLAYTQNVNNSGGFKTNNIILVSEAKKLKDHSVVALEGKITQQLKKDKYLFVDGSGNITIEIDSNVWNGLIVTPDETVIIYGEVDKDFGYPAEIEVSHIEKIK
ncbi:MAG: NirD/YgiW/YdeI family stress tolerance protein [Elusimicrobiota bacterium]|jgi:uncharacterized protein (TIGR00156 family)|nr:NirD/YgiW/YdeI family stress tolerance protein [Elusimicrobiota bacterium]